MVQGSCRMYIEWYIMDKETNGHLYIANDNLKRIADALDTIIKMVKEDQERSKKYMEEKKDE